MTSMLLECRPSVKFTRKEREHTDSLRCSYWTAKERRCSDAGSVSKHGEQRNIRRELSKGFQCALMPCALAAKTIVFRITWMSLSTAYHVRVELHYTGWVKKSKLLILSEYVNKTEKIGGTWTNKNSYRENKVLSDIFSWNILGHCFVLKYFMTESNQWNYC